MKVYDKDVEAMVQETARQCLVAAVQSSGATIETAEYCASLAYAVHSRVMEEMHKLPLIVP